MIELSAEVLMTQVDILSNASEITLFGGEPLFMKECRKFIHYMTTYPKLKDVRLNMATNGVLLDELLPTLRNKEKITLNVSVDGVGEIYEKIRHGGNWDRLSRNIEEMINIKNHYNKNWTITALCILMKSSIDAMPDFIRWANKIGVDFGFRPLFPTRQTGPEDFFQNPSLLDNVTEWREKFEESIGLLAKTDNHGSLAFLKQYYRDLTQKIEKQEYIPKAENKLNLKEQLGNVIRKGSKVVIWGTGSNYRHCYSRWLSENISHINFLGFIDNDPSTHGIPLDGHIIHSPDFLIKHKVDTILISSQHHHEIRDQIHGMGIQPAMIV